MDFKSKLGYSKGSPYSGNPYLDINTPNGLIDMSNTPHDLIGITPSGESQYMKANSTNPYQFNSTVVREIPLTKYHKRGGLTSRQIFDYLFKDEEQEGPLTTSQVENNEYLPEEDQRLIRLAEINQQIDESEQQVLDELAQFEEEQAYTRTLREEGNPNDLFPKYTSGNPYSGEILSSGQFGSQNIGEIGKQIYGDIANALGYTPIANSIYRSRAQQERLIAQGRTKAKDSYHLTGNAVDYSPKDWAKLSKSAKAEIEAKYRVINEGDHIHIQPK